MSSADGQTLGRRSPSSSCAVRERYLPRDSPKFAESLRKNDLKAGSDVRKPACELAGCGGRYWD
jgi:hypothetical protein